MKRIIKITLITIVAVITVVVTLLNSQPVKVNLYFAHFDLDLLVVVVVCLIAGALLGMVAAFGKLVSLKKDILRRDKKIRTMEKEVENLRSLPLKDDR